MPRYQFLKPNQKLNKNNFKELLNNLKNVATRATLQEGSNVSKHLSKIDIKKFFIAIVLGKIIMVYFWGYIGTSLLESLTDITIIFKIAILLVVAFLASKLVEKKLKVR